MMGVTVERMTQAVRQVRGWLPMVAPRVVARPVDRLAAVRVAAARIQGAERTTADLLVVRVGDGPAGALALKLPRSGRAAAALARERSVLGALAADDRLDGWRELLPRPLDADAGTPGSAPDLSPGPSRGPSLRHPHIGYDLLTLPPPLPLGTLPPPYHPLSQSWLPGVTAARLVTASPEVARRAAVASLSALGTLHQVTGKQIPVAPYLEEWTEPALDVLRQEVAWCRTEHGTAALAALRLRLRESLAGLVLPVGWTHGDFHPGNVLLSRDAAQVTGLIDWVQARPEGPLATDAMLYLLALRHLRSGQELGDCVVRTLRRGALGAEECALLEDAGLDAPPCSADGASLTLLTWLWHVSGNAAKSVRFGRSHRWVARNVIPVLRELRAPQVRYR